MSTGITGSVGRSGHSDPARERIAAAMVDLVGTEGYAATTIDAVCKRARAGRSHFDRCFAGKEDCYLSLHDELTAALAERVRVALVGASSWHDRIWAAGWSAMRFLREDPARPRFLLVEVNGAGAGGQARRARILTGLADLVDGGREGLEEPGRVSRCSAEIVAGSIYAMLVEKIERGDFERGEDFLSELVYMAVMPYLGARAAEDELLVQPLR